MAEGKINNPQLTTAFAEIAAVKLVLSVLLKAVLPDDARESAAEIDGMIKEVKILAFRAVAGGADRETSEAVMKVAEEQAVRLLQQVRPKAKG